MNMLTAKQFAILRGLSRGTAWPRQLAERLNRIDNDVFSFCDTSLSNALLSMEKKGLVSREREAGAGQGRPRGFWSLTPHGAAVDAQYRAAWLNLLEQPTTIPTTTTTEQHEHGSV